MPLDNKSELFYHVDKNDKIIGSITRGQAHSNKNLIHRAVCILIFNTKGELLFQKRSGKKDTYPHYWTLSASGHLTYGQEYLGAAKREAKEEIGILLKSLNFIKKLLLKLPNETEYESIFSTKISSPVRINYDRDEIEKVEWIDIKDIKEFTKKNKMTPETMIILKNLNYL